mmetsp:Transcript_15983/g.36504  ORF Transcript_15983/g.36504 Transcript_15983/m.36504 type:complete len:210 (-) Transcript_15983:643-1272(-)
MPPSGQARLVTSRVILVDLPGNDEALNLACAFINLCDPRISVVSFHRVVRYVTVSSQHLNRLMGAEGRGLRGGEFGHRRRLDEVLLVILHLRCSPGEEASGLDLQGHVGDLELDGLQLRDGAAERHTRLRVPHSGIQRCLCDPHSLARNADPAPVQGHHGNLETHAKFTQQVRSRNAAIFEDEAASSRRTNAELVLRLPCCETRSAFLY